MSKERDIALDMITEKASDIATLNSDIEYLLEDGEDDYYMEKVRWKSREIEDLTTERKILEELLRRADHATD